MNTLRKLLIPVAAIAITASASAMTLTQMMSLNTGGTNVIGTANSQSSGSLTPNTRTFTTGTSPNVTTASVTGWTSFGSPTGTLQSHLGQFSSGLGVEWNGDGSHTLDNAGPDNYMLFSFNKVVKLTEVEIGYVSGDSDIQVWFGNAAGATGANVDFILANAPSEIDGGGSSPSTATITGGNTGQYILIGGELGETNDGVKIKSLTFMVDDNTPHNTPDSGATVALLGLGLLGLAAARKRFGK